MQMHRQCLLVVITALCLLGSCQPPLSQFSGETMGTSYSVAINEDIDPAYLSYLHDQVQQVLDRINRMMSTYIDDSELSRFNRSRSIRWQPASPALAKVVMAAQTVSQLSNGAFDVTVAPLVNIWGFGPALPSSQEPEQTVIDGLMKQVGYQYLAVKENPPSMKKDLPKLSVDLSAIAKGYAVDQIVMLLDTEGVQNFLVDIGGELRGRGVNAKQQTWRVGIEKPDNTLPRTAFQIIQLDNRAIATSGDYKNYRTLNGRRYSHEINPSSGRPVIHSTASVSVVADSAMIADAWATALLVMGSQQGMVLANKLDIAALFIDRQEGELFVMQWSNAFDPMLVKDN